ncbi:MAG: hypothetical protein QM610_12825 [Chitinophagaceae bacterium]
MSNNFAYHPSKVLLPVMGSQHSSQHSYNYQPLLSGDKFPAIVLNRSSFISVRDQDLFGQSFTSLQDILDYPQPLVLAFLSVTNKVVDVNAWKSLQADIEIMGGRLLIVTNGDSRHFTHKIRKENQLNIWEDRHGQLSEDVGLFDLQNPISDWLSGIDTDIPLPAFYVVGQDQTILFHHIDYALRTVDGKDFSNSSFVRNLLTSVYQASSEKNNQLRRAIS